MTALTILTTIAGPLCAIGVALLFAAIGTLTNAMPRQGIDAAEHAAD